MPIRAEPDTGHCSVVTGERVADRPAIDGVPQPHAAIDVAEARRWPSGLYATPFTWPVWPVMIFSVLARAITAA